ncbi:MAG: hypothetical protein ACREID_01500, partial [Planctomycetota bacterium]
MRATGRTWYLILLTACAGLGEGGPRVEASAAREEGGLRVWFRRSEAGTSGHLPALAAEGGRLEELIYSPDRLSVSALWREPRGEVRC